MADVQPGQPRLLLQLLQQGQDPGSGHRVERGRGLVCDDQRWPCDQRLGQGNALAFAAAQLMGISRVNPLGVGKTDLGQGSQNRGFGFLPRSAVVGSPHRTHL